MFNNFFPRKSCLFSVMWDSMVEPVRPQMMGWEVLPHPSYSPDLAPSDYHLFGLVNDQLRDNVMRQRRQFRKQCFSVFGWLERNFTEGEFSNSQNAGRNVYKGVTIMWKNKERSVD